MKKLTNILILLLISTSIFSQDLDIRITEVPYNPPYAFMRIHFDFAGSQPVEILSDNSVVNARSQLGFGIGLISAKESDIQFEYRFSYRMVDLSNLNLGLNKHSDFDIILGGRYYPRYPTFGLSKNTPVRVTLAALGGLDMRGAQFADQMAIDVILNAGLVISSKDNPSGLMVEFQYRPLGSDAIGSVYLKPSYTFCVSWLFGP